MFHILQPTMLIIIIVAILLVILWLALIISILEWSARRFLFWQHL